MLLNSPIKIDQLLSVMPDKTSKTVAVLCSIFNSFFVGKYVGLPGGKLLKKVDLTSHLIMDKLLVKQGRSVRF